MITLQELKTYLNITDDTKDVFLQACIDASVREIEDYCKRKLTSGTYTEYIDGKDKTEIYLRNSPLHSVTSISVYNYYDSYDSIFTSGDTASNSTIILTATNSIKLLKGYYFFKGCKNIKVVYVSGYDTDTAPQDLKSVLKELASLKFYNSPLSGHARLGKASDNVNSATGESTSFQTPDWKTVLNTYRLQNI